MKTPIGLQDICARCRNKLLTFLVFGSFCLKFPSHLNSSHLFSPLLSSSHFFSTLLSCFWCSYALRSSSHLFSPILSASCLFFSSQLFLSPSQLQATTHRKNYVFQGIPTAQKYYFARISDIPSGNIYMIYLFWYLIWYLFDIYLIIWYLFIWYLFDIYLIYIYI